ncbi:cellulase family glycosylhydrolase [Sinomicrobium weinanense]|uniref:Cellulase family glycosylhydrolase n=1 Tax=Sinomicrobium weinanense TaxID=2842200 RepID=A0A926Q3Q6_9FLAO|nr:cellulase family glycosylhydrolase [Sinomicrobium weinanense]MBC9797184.1 cellulase family glycosylhydrolase [Sinomicrobium weinanense]MBU3125840.1 glycoside hydrolase family 5 protein [Sinomicrobium weinanense]
MKTSVQTLSKLPKRIPTGTWTLLLSLILCIVLAGCKTDEVPPLENENISSDTYQYNIGLSLNGKEILLDGAPFYPRGYVFESLLYKKENLIEYAQYPEYEEFCTRQLAAQDYYFGKGDFTDNSGLDLARAWGANTIRLNLNQGALDPQNQYYSENYVQLVRRAVSAARNKDFVVILTIFVAANKNIPQPMQDENPNIPINNPISLGACVKLAELFGDDPYIMLETLNEPWSPTRRDFGWEFYRDGGTPSAGCCPGVEFVGVNTIIQAMRDKGAKNLIIVQGLKTSFKGFPGGFVDPLDKIVYSVHPFFGDGSDPERIDWDGNFGFMAEQYPFLITAWGAPLAHGWCDEFGLNKPIEFLNYIDSKNIGMMAYALDVPFTTIRDFRTDPIEPTVLGNQCSTWAGRGTGEIIRDYFLSF